ncbi:MAG: hypothetical protein AB7G13_05245 [Lautropia sp.]
MKTTKRTIVTVAQCARVTTFGFVARDVRAFDAAARDARARAMQPRAERVRSGCAQSSADGSTAVAQRCSKRMKSS